MKMRWLAAGIAAVLITGGAATVAQRVITQKTRGVLPETNDAAHPDARRPELVQPMVGTLEGRTVKLAQAPPANRQNAVPASPAAPQRADDHHRAEPPCRRSPAAHHSVHRPDRGDQRDPGGKSARRLG